MTTVSAVPAQFLLDGRRVNSCLLFPVAVTGTDITTIEGLARSATLHQAFVDHDALQCGYCTPGQICSAAAMLAEAAAGWPSGVTADIDAERITLDGREVAERMSGNLCRCGAYAHIVPAILDAAR